MEDRISRFLKAAKGFQAGAKALDALSKARTKTTADPVAILESASKAGSELTRLEGLDHLIRELSGDLAVEADACRKQIEKDRALLAGKVAGELGQSGIRVEGNLPVLRAGPFSLEFVFGAKGQCVIWFGPRQQRLAIAPLDAEAIAVKVRELDSGLFGEAFDEPAFLESLFQAYRRALAGLDRPDGERVPIALLMSEMAFLRQKPAFHADPRRDLFTSYGRVEFAADLSRVRERRAHGRELRLDVATLSQSKRAEDHVWVPRGRSGDGVILATAAFVKAREENR
jgi:hypothetical protein